LLLIQSEQELHTFGFYQNNYVQQLPQIRDNGKESQHSSDLEKVTLPVFSALQPMLGKDYFTDNSETFLQHFTKQI